MAVVLPQSQPVLVWLVVERQPHHFIIDATEEGTGRRVRIVLSLRASASMSTALRALAKVDPAEEPAPLELATKGKIEVVA